MITSGTREVKQKGKIEINAETTDANKKLELILRGNTQGDTVTRLIICPFLFAIQLTFHFGFSFQNSR